MFGTSRRRIVKRPCAGGWGDSGSPAARTSSFHCKGHGSIPWLEPRSCLLCGLAKEKERRMERGLWGWLVEEGCCILCLGPGP